MTRVLHAYPLWTRARDEMNKFAEDRPGCTVHVAHSTVFANGDEHRFAAVATYDDLMRIRGQRYGKVWVYDGVNDLYRELLASLQR